MKKILFGFFLFLIFPLVASAQSNTLIPLEGSGCVTYDAFLEKHADYATYNEHLNNIAEIKADLDEIDEDLNDPYLTNNEELDLLDEWDETDIELEDEQRALRELSTKIKKEYDENSESFACDISKGTINIKGVKQYLIYLIDFAIGISGIIAVLFLVIGGYQYVIGGVMEKKEEAKTTIMWAIIGLVIVLLAWVIVEIVQRMLTS